MELDYRYSASRGAEEPRQIRFEKYICARPNRIRSTAGLHSAYCFDALTVFIFGRAGVNSEICPKFKIDCRQNTSNARAVITRRRTVIVKLVS